MANFQAAMEAEMSRFEAELADSAARMRQATMAAQAARAPPRPSMSSAAITAQTFSAVQQHLQQQAAHPLFPPPPPPPISSQDAPGIAPLRPPPPPPPTLFLPHSLQARGPKSASRLSDGTELPEPTSSGMMQNPAVGTPALNLPVHPLAPPPPQIPPQRAPRPPQAEPRGQFFSRPAVPLTPQGTLKRMPPPPTAATPVVGPTIPAPSVNRPTVPTPVVIMAAPQRYHDAPRPGDAALDAEIAGFKKETAKEMAKRVQASATKTKVVVDSRGDGFGGGKKGKKNRKAVRVAGGELWQDPSLEEWDPNDFRIFCGDLGNDVNEDVLTRTFSKYPSFQKSKVVRDRRTNKSKGFGFVSFKDPKDYVKAMREMNGKYVGSRPIKLRKSNWKDRNLDIVRKKIEEKVSIGFKP